MRRALLRFLTAYGSLFEQPGTTGFVAAGFVSRLTGAMAIVGLVLAITEHGEGDATAGAGGAGLTPATGVALPVFGRLIDQYGQHRVLAPTSVAFGGLMLLLIGAIGAGAPGWLLVLLAVAAGGPMPVAGPLGRAPGVQLYQ